MFKRPKNLRKKILSKDVLLFFNEIILFAPIIVINSCITSSVSLPSMSISKSCGAGMVNITESNSDLPPSALHTSIWNIDLSNVGTNALHNIEYANFLKKHRQFSV